MILVFSINFIIYAFFLSWSYKGGSLYQRIYPTRGNDSTEYLTLAENIVEKGVFTIDSSLGAPDTLRTPGYPLFLAGILLFFKNPKILPFFQIILLLITSLLIFLIGCQIYSPKAGFFAGLFYGINPITSFYTAVIYSDILFVFLVILFTYLYIKRIFEINYYWAFSGGLILGCLTLVRSIGLYLIVLVLIITLIGLIRVKIKTRLVLAVFFMILGSCVVLVPWCVRNYRISKVFSLSSLSTYNFANYNLMLFLEKNRESNPEEFISYQNELNRIGNLRLLQNQDKILALIKKYLAPNLAGYITFHIKGSIIFLFKSDIESAIQIYNRTIHPGYPAAENKSFVSLWRKTTDHWRYLVESAFWGVALLLSFYSVFYRKFDPNFIFFFLFIILFMLLTGPVSYDVRYRIPAQPFLLLSFFGSMRPALSEIRRLISGKYKNETGRI
ncbi:MAG: hypothetical protein CEN90_333 [Parcubacteria group bacterium Licking1014_17]|nr:MAG: hypothetical protein CEN90_333 [Parcubacteria group bacterium Licking1014_17]